MPHLVALGEFLTTHWLPVLGSVVAFMVLGFLWYGPFFEKSWVKLSGLEGMSKQQMQSRMVPAFTITIITGLVQATILGRGLELVALASVVDALIIATILWLPFTGLVIFMHYAFAHKPWKLAAIDAGFVLVSLWIMSAILYWGIA